ncbi:MAG: Steryl-sulfatase [Sphingobacteriales bacterium]|nr:Steryl-sulfatase [Sphingobacteriales bacterium]
MKQLRVIALLILLAFVGCEQKIKVDTKPNIVLIYIDDLGYGDLSCYGAKALKTPNIDGLANNGLLFTDAHSAASTCTPSRYSLLTGSYAFRNNAAILPGDAPLIINQNQETIADMLKKAGYATGVIGKWHLGLGNGKPDWNAEVKPGPREIGFDYSFLIPATPDRVPTVFVENDKVVNLDLKDPISINYDQKIGNDPVGLEHPELLKMPADTQHSGTIVNGISRIGFMKGGHNAYWKDEDFATVLTQKAKAFITTNRDKPFFLYYSLPGIHVPRSPNSKFVGATTMGPRGDDIMEIDWMTGQIKKILRELAIEKNTLIIFTSDNGPVLDDGYADKAVQLIGNHKASGIYKGGKYSAYEGGTRMPTIAYWPNRIEPGKSDALISQVDLFASLAKLVRQDNRNSNVAPDSQDMLSALLGKSKKGRDVMLEEAFTMSIRAGYWKYIEPVSKKTPDWLANKDVATGLQKTQQLYNLKDDPKEEHNLAVKFPKKVKELKEALEKIKENPVIANN